MKNVFFKHNPDVAVMLVLPENNLEILTVEEFVKFNIYNKESIKYCFAKHSPLSVEQQEVLRNYLLNFKNGDIAGYDKNLEKWVKMVKI